MNESIRCPTCGSVATPIAYGYPSVELFEAAERGQIRLGGCIIDGSQPELVCEACGPRWAGGGPTRADRIRGCLLAGGVGDALGAGIEFASLVEIRRHFGAKGLAGYAPAYGRPGAITDDTQMTLFTLEGLLRARATGGTDVGLVHEAYLRWLHTQGRLVGRDDVLDGWLVEQEVLHHQRAPGNTCLAALEATAAPDERLGTPKHALNNSKGCGGVMRAAPAGFWPERSQVFRLGCELAALTHGHPSGYLTAGVLAATVAELLDGVPLPLALLAARRELLNWDGHRETLDALDSGIRLGERGLPAPEELEMLGGGWVGEEALAIAVACALGAPDLRSALLAAVNHSGDSDSTGALCGNLLGAARGVEAIPQEWLEELEARDVIERLAKEAVAILCKT